MPRKSHRHVIARLWSDASGATSTEYAMLIAIIAAALLSAASYLGKNLNTTFDATDDGLAVALASGHSGHGSSSDGNIQPGIPQAGSSPSDGESPSGSGTAAGAGSAAGPIDSDEQASGSDTGQLIRTER
ncbi:hypothetical protein A9D14_04870 [Croceicoccus marinus]|uniref:Flp family type IVb pilin n=1 Tax=Croceicoccus marinus TaxID=450378 RepID=A0A1Z1FA78_9SPHN|nr:hypothetical protein A9D14_04870 [Croceicoccus marinus]